MERLQLSIFSQDSGLVGLVRAALQDLGVAGSYFDIDSARALEVLRSRHFDGIVLDCNDLAYAQQILAGIRRGPSNRQTPVIAIVNDATDMRAIQSSGASYNVCKPVSPATLKAHLTKAFDAIQKEHRRYFRYTVSLELFVGAEKAGFTSARLINLIRKRLIHSLLQTSAYSLSVVASPRIRFSTHSIGTSPSGK